MKALRRATIDDIPALAAIHRRSFFTAMPHMPALHTATEDVEFYSNQVFPCTTIWLAEETGTPIGFIAYRKDWVDQFYIDPFHQGRGLGTELLVKAKSENRILNLWTFQCNLKARRFYEKQGFLVIKQTDGSDNEEHQPDMLYIWKRDSIASL